MSIFWLVALIVFGIVEGLTVGLTSLWFALGSLVALVAALLGASTLVQVILFLAVSALTLAFIRPISQKLVNKQVIPTNADRAIGQEAIVTEDIDNVEARGHVTIAGVQWAARSQEEAPIPAGARVRVLRIEGVKVFVTPIE